MLEREGVTASFYITMGPDNSGRAILRVFRNRGFLSKMFRTKAVSMYGMRTILSGTLLPSRPIALAFPEIIRDLKARGFEVGVHGYDHVRWQDHLDDIGEDGVRNELGDAFEVYRAILGEAVAEFRRARMAHQQCGAARARRDGTRLSQRHARRRAVSMRRRGTHARDARDSDHAADARRGDGSSAICRMTPRCVEFYLGLCKPDALNVHTIHAETEGMGQLEIFTALVRALKERGAKFVQLREVACAAESRGTAGVRSRSHDAAGQGGMDFGAGSGARSRPNDESAAVCYIPGTTIQPQGVPAMPTQSHFADSPREIGLDPEKVEALFNRAEREVKDGLLPSTQIAIARNGKIGAMRTVGRAVQGGSEKPATNDTFYVIFSCTKAIMSAASWILIGEGKLSPSEVVAEIIPEFGTNGKDKMTVEQVLLHVGGFPNAPFPQDEWLDKSKRLERFAKWRLEWPVGSQVRIPSDVRLLGNCGDHRTPHRQGLSSVRAGADFDAARTAGPARRFAARAAKSRRAALLRRRSAD